MGSLNSNPNPNPRPAATPKGNFLLGLELYVLSFPPFRFHLETRNGGALISIATLSCNRISNILLVASPFQGEFSRARDTYGNKWSRKGGRFQRSNLFVPDRNLGKGSVVKCIIISVGEELRRGYPTVKTIITEQYATIIILSIPYYHSIA